MWCQQCPHKYYGIVGLGLRFGVRISVTLVWLVTCSRLLCSGAILKMSKWFPYIQLRSLDVAFPTFKCYLYIGWSDITYLCSQSDRHFVGQHVVLCVAKWWTFVALFESNWISWFKKMSVLWLSYWESDVYWRQNDKYFPTKWQKNWYQEIISLSPDVLHVGFPTLCSF